MTKQPLLKQTLSHQTITNTASQRNVVTTKELIVSSNGSKYRSSSILRYRIVVSNNDMARTIKVVSTCVEKSDSVDKTGETSKNVLVPTSALR